MRKILVMALTEARMSTRGWRFWLLLLLIGGLSLLARDAFLRYIDSGYYLHPAFAFQSPSFWLMFAVSILGTTALSLDAAGRLRRTRIDKILFPLPVGSLQLFWGMFIGVLIVVLPLSALGLFSLAFWQALHGHAPVIWQPFWVAFLFLLLPVLVPLSAGVIMLRTFFKNDFAALVALCAMTALVGAFHEHHDLLLDFKAVALTLINASPNLGALIHYQEHWLPLLAHFLLAYVLLSLAPLYLRRQQPQPVVLTASNHLAFQIKPLLQWLHALRIDRNLGWTYRAAFSLALILCAAGGMTAIYQYQELTLQKMREREDQSIVQDAEIRIPPIDAQKLIASIRPHSPNQKIRIEAALHFTVTEQTKTINFELDPRYQLLRTRHSEIPVRQVQHGRWVQVRFARPLSPGEREKLVFEYEGQPQHFHPRFSRLEDTWYPKPWNRHRSENGDWVKEEEDYLQAELTLHLRPDQAGAFAGELTALHENERERIEEWHTLYPTDTMLVQWGAYQSSTAEKPGYTLRFFHLPFHGYKAAVYLEEIREQEEFIHEKLGPLPFSQITIIETPYIFSTTFDITKLFQTNLYQSNRSENRGFGGFGDRGDRGRGGGFGGRGFDRDRDDVQPTGANPARTASVKSMPGSIIETENNLAYLDERMWRIERADHDPSKIPFYEQVPRVLNVINNQYFQNLISVYFDHTLQPAGDYAFWLEEHLTGYAASLLEKNSWKRRSQLNFDIGTGPDLPLSVAGRDPLLQLHRQNRYPKLEEVRGRGLFRMLHHLLGEEAWWELMQEIFREHRFQPLTADEFLSLAETYYGESLAWFKQQWLEGTVLPQYEITRAVARVIELQQDSEVIYETQISVKNHGTGRMAVPVFLETEMDYIFRDLWLDSGEETTLQLHVPHRPVYAMVDPQNWIVQEPFFDPARNRRMHAEARVTIVGGDVASRNPRRGDFGRRRGWR